MRKVCLAIGVSRAEGLAPLRGAASAAEEVGEWARISGFADPVDICVLTDRRDEPVTTERIAEAITSLLPQGKATDTFLLYFAGHGLREDNTRTLWLPTNWRTALRAIAVERLKNRLSDYGVANLTIIGDACKSLANDKNTSDLTPDGILGLGPSAGSRPVFDRFDAVHDIEAAFMVPGPTPEESRCLFSGALLEGLWGRDDSVFDTGYPGKVTPGSLADYVEKRVEELCLHYGLKCQPQNVTGRPADHVIYFEKGRPLAGALPPFRPWPEVVRPAPGGLTETITTGIMEAAGKAVGKMTGGLATLGFEPSIDLGEVVTDGGKAWLRNRKRGAKKERQASANRLARRKNTENAFRQIKDLVPWETNLVANGGKVARIWSSCEVERKGSRQWKLSVSPGGAEQVVIEYHDGVFVPVAIYADLITVATRDAVGTTGWMCLSGSGEMDCTNSVATIVRLQAGELEPGSVDSIAADLRFEKHANPVLGAICAYLYDYVGDLDSIRRMASFYVQHYQPIPFDIALMGELQAWNDNGRQKVSVPQVNARLSASNANLPSFVTQATPNGEQAVGGYCPWLRQGWDFVDAPTDRESPLVDGLAALRPHLLRTTFTSFDRKGGETLVQQWKMEAAR